MGKRFRYRFKHGLGDAVQFACVLRHVREQNPGCHITLETTPGREAIFRHVVDELISPLPYPWKPHGYDDARYIKFPHTADQHFDHLPPSKITECFSFDFANTITPVPELYEYAVAIDPQAAGRVAQWFSKLKRPIITFHYEGVSCPEKKNIPISKVKGMAWAMAGDTTVVLLDWRHNKIHNGETIVVPPNGNIPQDSDHLAALIDQSDAFIGIDSGPAHIAGALNTPSWVIWYGHFPSMCFDHMAINVEHVLTMDAVTASPSDKAWEWFKQNYRYTISGANDYPYCYSAEDVAVEGALHVTGVSESHPHIEQGLAKFDNGEWPPMIIYLDEPMIEFEP